MKHAPGYLLLLNGINEQLPTDVAALRIMLPMILGRQDVAARDSNLVAARGAAIDPRMRRSGSGGMRTVEGRIVSLRQPLTKFVQRHTHSPHQVNVI